MDILQSIISKGDICFDVGANIGKKTEMFLNLGASVVCIEPQQKCVNILNSKFSDNQSVEIVNSALGEKEDVLDIFISSADTLTTMSRDFIEKTKKERFQYINWNEIEKVNVTTLDNLIVKFGLPKYCKIDVEGYEVEVLKGLTKPIKYISVEFTPELKEKTFECMSILNNISEYEYNYSEGESHLFSFENWISSQEMIKFLEKNNDFRISFGDLYARLR
jgi:FkbM family methyltransferase